PGSDPEKYGGIAKVNAATGEIVRLYEQSVPGNGATLVTAGDLLFWRDLNQKLRAFDAGTGKILWETILGGPIQTSTINVCREWKAIRSRDHGLRCYHGRHFPARWSHRHQSGTQQRNPRVCVTELKIRTAQ